MISNEYYEVSVTEGSTGLAGAIVVPEGLGHFKVRKELSKALERALVSTGRNSVAVSYKQRVTCFDITCKAENPHPDYIYDIIDQIVKYVLRGTAEVKKVSAADDKSVLMSITSKFMHRVSDSVNGISGLNAEDAVTESTVFPGKANTGKAMLLRNVGVVSNKTENLTVELNQSINSRAEAALDCSYVLESQARFDEAVAEFDRLVNQSKVNCVDFIYQKKHTICNLARGKSMCVMAEITEHMNFVVKYLTKADTLAVQDVPNILFDSDTGEEEVSEKVEEVESYKSEEDEKVQSSENLKTTETLYFVEAENFKKGIFSKVK